MQGPPCLYFTFLNIKKHISYILNLNYFLNGIIYYVTILGSYYIKLYIILMRIDNVKALL